DTVCTRSQLGRKATLALTESAPGHLPMPSAGRDRIAWPCEPFRSEKHWRTEPPVGARRARARRTHVLSALRRSALFLSVERRRWRRIRFATSWPGAHARAHHSHQAARARAKCARREEETVTKRVRLGVVFVVGFASLPTMAQAQGASSLVGSV